MSVALKRIGGGQSVREPQLYRCLCEGPVAREAGAAFHRYRLGAVGEQA